MKDIITEPYFSESNIPEVNNSIFKVEKQSHPISYDEDTQTFGFTDISIFTYKQDVFHRYMNVHVHGKAMVGDCRECGAESNDMLDGATWGDILVLGLGGFGVLPQYIKENKNPTSIDVVEEYQEIIDYVTWLDSSINVICHDEWTYSTLKQYDIIICDLYADREDITANHKTSLLNNYSNNLKVGGRLVIPKSGETIN